MGCVDRDKKRLPEEDNSSKEVIRRPLCQKFDSGKSPDTFQEDNQLRIENCLYQKKRNIQIEAGDMPHDL